MNNWKLLRKMCDTKSEWKQVKRNAKKMPSPIRAKMFLDLKNRLSIPTSGKSLKA